MATRRDRPTLAQLERDLAAAVDAGLVATADELRRQIARHKPKGRNA